MEVNTVLYGIVSVGRYCNSVSVKEAIKAYRKFIIFSSNLPEHTILNGKTIGRDNSPCLRCTGDKHINTHDFTILTVVKIKEQ